MCTIRVFRGLANQVAPRAGSVLRGRLKVHNSKSGTCQGGVFLVYCMMYFIILIYLIILQLSRGASGKEFFGARTHGFCTHQARPTCKNTGKVNNRSRETGTHGRYCIKSNCDHSYLLGPPRGRAFFFVGGGQAPRRRPGGAAGFALG